MKKNRGKKMSWCSDAPEDDVIPLFTGLFVNPDGPLSVVRVSKFLKFLHFSVHKY